MSNIRIEKVNKKNWKRASLIEMKPEQQNLLASVTYCLARAYVSPYQDPIRPYVIYSNNDLIGFFWFAFVDDQGTCILCGFRIDKAFQGFGYSKKALSEFVKLLKSEYPKCNCIQLFVEENNIPAMNLYHGFGFETIQRNRDNNLELMVFKMKENIVINPINEECLNDE